MADDDHVRFIVIELRKLVCIQVCISVRQLVRFAEVTVVMDVVEM